MNAEGSKIPLRKDRPTSGQTRTSSESNPADVVRNAAQDEQSLMRHLQRRYDPAAMKLLRKLRDEASSDGKPPVSDGPLGAVLAEEQARLQEREAEVATLGTTESLQVQADLESRLSVLEDGIAATRHKKSQPS